MSKFINISIDEETEVLLMDTVIRHKLSQSRVVRAALQYYCENYDKIKHEELAGN